MSAIASCGADMFLDRGLPQLSPLARIGAAASSSRHTYQRDDHMAQASRAMVLLVAIACWAIDPVQAADHPNIVLILADDLGYGDVRALNPDSSIPTPNLDRLAERGLSFTDAHTPSAVCTPTRYGLLTGRYCWRGRLKQGVLNGYGARLIEQDRLTVAALLKSAGYTTGIVGKWHLGLGWRRIEGDAIDFTAPVADSPNELGFDYSHIIPASLDFPPYVYIENGRVTDPATVQQEKQGFPAFLRDGPRAADFVMEDALDHLTEQATGFIKANADAKRPFFLYFPLTAPHKPVLPHSRFRGRTELGEYGDFVTQVDWVAGRINQTLEETGAWANTLLIFTSDNGSFMFRLDDANARDHVDERTIQAFRAARHRSNGPWRGTKADIWEGGHRVPFFAVWPGVVEAGSRTDKTICLTDFLATAAEIAGADGGPNAAEDSYSFLSLLHGDESDWARPPVVHHSVSGMFAIRAGRWKLVAGNGSGGRERPAGKPFEEPYQLFDLVEDPAETTDLAANQSEIVARMTDALDKFRADGRSVKR